MGGENHPAPRVINTDEHPGYPSAIVQLKAEGALEENCQHRPVQYLEQRFGTGSSGDQAPDTRKPAFSVVLKELGARRAGYEAIHMIRKGQACWSATGTKVCLLHRFIVDLFAATN